MRVSTLVILMVGFCLGILIGTSLKTCPPVLTSPPRLQPGLQLSCSARDRAEYLEICNRRLKGI